MSLHDLAAIIPPLIIAISAIVDAIRRSKKASTLSPPSSGPTASALPPMKAAKKPVAIATGYAGRTAQANLPEHARAIDSAGSRLSSGTEYPSIVAERAADRAAEERFAAEVRVLEQSEPKRAPVSASVLTSPPQPLTALQASLAARFGASAPLISAVILSEILSSPRCKRKR
jgi:hypothetical protein